MLLHQLIVVLVAVVPPPVSRGYCSGQLQFLGGIEVLKVFFFWFPTALELYSKAVVGFGLEIFDFLFEVLKILLLYFDVEGWRGSVVVMTFLGVEIAGHIGSVLFAHPAILGPTLRTQQTPAFFSLALTFLFKRPRHISRT